MIERQRLIDAYTDLSRRLTVHYMKTGQPRESDRTCDQVLEEDGRDEDTHRLLMGALSASASGVGRLRQYKLCEQVLRHEYDMTPSLETRALYTNIMKHDGPR
jgi:DNA-binding SARP family transcriptional activator